MENYWSEIRNHHVDEFEDNGVISISIDAYKTGDPDEHGEVVAKVFGKVVNDTAFIFVDYRNHIANTDITAQESIKEAKKIMEQLLNG
jgi:hypothetical protein